MDNKSLSQFQTLLLKRQNILHELENTNENSSKIVELDQARVGRLSRMDALQDQAMSQEVNRRRQLELSKITIALNKINKDEYGYCVECDNEIAIKRLQLDPSVSLCISCASNLE